MLHLSFIYRGVIEKAGLIILGLSTLLIVAIIWGQSQWHRDTLAVTEQIKVSSRRQQQSVDLSEIQDLPVALKKYFHLVLKEGAPIIHAATLTQTGGFRARPEMTDWSTMQATQVFSTAPPAFVWDASISAMQGIDIKVRDSYRNGQGAMRVKLAYLFPLIDAHNDQELNEAALQRYLAEAVWFPTALLPSQGVTWRELASNKAIASITDFGMTVSLEFEFNPKGEISSVYSPARYREVSGNYEPTPWKGHFSDYAEFDGYRIPTSAAVEWHLPGQAYAYWRASLHAIRYISN